GKDAAPRTICESLFGPAILEASDPPVRAIWVTAGNPVAMLLESRTTVKALEQFDLLIVADTFLTDTAQLADLVLPIPTLLESDDLLGAYGHHYLGVSQPVVPAPAGVRSDLQIMQGLAERVGLRDALSGSARDWKRRLLADGLAQHDVSLERLEQGVVKNPLAERILFAGRHFPTESGKVNLMSDPAPPLPALDPDYPLTLLSLSTLKSQSF
ncbi:molybdopterin-dependent oxidoreductase, partial [Endomicrobium sp. AH-315-J14]|nr:molybdopterin-dependent oxidoreductase [Endomicrobium sp. AH-315-J14]